MEPAAESVRSDWTRRAGLLFVVAYGFALQAAAVLALGDITRTLAFVPDDTFYYLGIARNLARSGISSFDGGQTLTTGYHVLWERSLVWLCMAVDGEPEAFLRATVLLGAAALLLPIGWLGYRAWRDSQPALLAAMAVSMTSYGFLDNLVSGMEWPLVVAVHALFASWLLRGAPHGRSSALAIGFFAGIVGTLARSDFVASTVAYTAAAAWVAWRHRDRRFVLPTAASLAGALVGAVAIAVHNQHISGSWVQGSARMKLLWGAGQGLNPAPFLGVLLRSLVFLPRAPLGLTAATTPTWLRVAAGLLAVSAGAWVARAAFRSNRLGALRASLAELDARRAFVLCAAVFLLVGYTLAYSRNALGMQIWYSAHVTTALVGLTYLALERWLTRLPMAIAVVALCAWGMIGFSASEPIYTWQKHGREEGLLLAQRFSGQRIGLSDAGMIGFFQGGSIINLDGLVNDEIVDYAPGRLHCYLLHRRIELFSGFGLAASLVFPLRDFDSYSRPTEIVRHADGTSYELRAVDLSQLARLPECRAELASP